MTAMDREIASQEVSGILDSLHRAWLEGHPEDLFPLFDDKIVMALPGGGRISGRDALVASFEEFVRSARVLDFRETDRQIDVFPGIAIASYGYAIVYEREGGRYRATGRELWIFRRSDGQPFRAVFRTMYEVAEEPAAPSS